MSLIFSFVFAPMSFYVNWFFNFFASLLLSYFYPIFFLNFSIISSFVDDNFETLYHFDFCKCFLLILQIIFYLFQTVMVFTSLPVFSSGHSTSDSDSCFFLPSILNWLGSKKIFVSFV